MLWRADSRCWGRVHSEVFQSRWYVSSSNLVPWEGWVRGWRRLGGEGRNRRGTVRAAVRPHPSFSLQPSICLTTSAFTSQRNRSYTHLLTRLSGVVVL